MLLSLFSCSKTELVCLLTCFPLLLLPTGLHYTYLAIWWTLYNATINHRFSLILNCSQSESPSAKTFFCSCFSLSLSLCSAFWFELESFIRCNLQIDHFSILLSLSFSHLRNVLLIIFTCLITKQTIPKQHHSLTFLSETFTFPFKLLSFPSSSSSSFFQLFFSIFYFLPPFLLIFFYFVYFYCFSFFLFVSSLVKLS